MKINMKWRRKRIGIEENQCGGARNGWRKESRSISLAQAYNQVKRNEMAAASK